MFLDFVSNPANSARNVPLIHQECGGLLMSHPTIQILSKFCYTLAFLIWYVNVDLQPS